MRSNAPTRIGSCQWGMQGDKQLFASSSARRFRVSFTAGRKECVTSRVTFHTSTSATSTQGSCRWASDYWPYPSQKQTSEKENFWMPTSSVNTLFDVCSSTLEQRLLLFLFNCDWHLMGRSNQTSLPLCPVKEIKSWRRQLKQQRTKKV